MSVTIFELLRDRLGEVRILDGDLVDFELLVIEDDHASQLALVTHLDQQKFLKMVSLN